MKPLDPDAESLLREWIEKAEADLEAAGQLVSSVARNIRLREIVGFHCQQIVVGKRSAPGSAGNRAIARVIAHGTLMEVMCGAVA